MNKISNKLQTVTTQIWPSVMAILLALLVSGLLLLATGHNPLNAFGTLFRGAFGNVNRFAETLVKTIPILIIALGTSVAFKCKLWNIGGNGQYTIGAIAAVAVAVYVPIPYIFRIPLSFLASVSAGVILGGLIGWLRARMNANEVITTLMINYIVMYMLSWLVNSPMIDPEGFGFPQTKLVPEQMRLSVLIPGTRLHMGLLIAVVLVLVGIVFWKSKPGFRISLTGESTEVAKASGINVEKHIILTMMISAAIPAIAGWVDVFGIHGRLQENLPGELGTIAVVVALLGGLNPIGITFSALFFSALVVGGSSMQRFEGVPYSLVGIIQGLIIIFVICRVVYEEYKEKKIVRQSVL